MTPTEKLLSGYRSTLAEIIYRMPDHPDVLQQFIWRDLDLAPQFPVLKGFLDFWTRELDGPLHTVRVAHASVLSAAEFRFTEERLIIQ